MQFHRQFAGALAMLGASMGSVAGNLDGSAPFLCAVTEAVGCEMEGDCVQGPATAVNFPVFIRIDAEKKVVQSHRQSGDDRVSEILSVHQEDSAVVFLGVDQGQGWSLTVNQTTGQMTASTSADGVGYVVFGACTPL